MIDFKGGKLDFVESYKDIKLGNYLDTGVLPALPTDAAGNYLPIGNLDAINAITKSGWGMCKNDTIGDCAVAGPEHETKLYTYLGSYMALFTDANSIADYSAISGYNPNDPSTDTGCVVRDVLNYRVKTGMIDGKGVRHKIGAFAAVDQTKEYEVLMGLYLFGIIGIGIQFPDSAMTQFNNGQPWDVVKGAKIEGGHYVCILYFDGTYFWCVTWGAIQKMTLAFFLKYVDEAWIPFSTEFMKNNVSPLGFNLAQLQADIAAIPNMVPPNVNPTPPNVPPTDKQRLDSIKAIIATPKITKTKIANGVETIMVGY